MNFIPYNVSNRTLTITLKGWNVDCLRLEKNLSVVIQNYAEHSVSNQLLQDWVRIGPSLTMQFKVSDTKFKLASKLRENDGKR